MAEAERERVRERGCPRNWLQPVSPHVHSMRPVFFRCSLRPSVTLPDLPESARWFSLSVELLRFCLGVLCAGDLERVRDLDCDPAAPCALCVPWLRFLDRRSPCVEGESTSFVPGCPMSEREVLSTISPSSCSLGAAAASISAPSFCPSLKDSLCADEAASTSGGFL